VWPHKPIIFEPYLDNISTEKYWSSANSIKHYLKWRIEENSRLYIWIKKLIYKKKEINCFEIGVGDGELLYKLKKFCNKYYGIEPDKTAYKRVKMNKNIYNYTAENYFKKKEFKNLTKFFDLVMLISVFEHISRPDIFIEKVKTKIKKGGLLIISVPNSESFFSFYFLRKLFNLEPWSYFHISFFNVNNLKYLLEKNNFKIKQLDKHSLLSENSILYFQKRYNSKILGFCMRLFKVLRLDIFFNMNTVFLVCEKTK
jgi:2-polyprenyl-3-methyl-5-hydroxy-6-metoxy-1,4-benzoquinol methylase